MFHILSQNQWETINRSVRDLYQVSQAQGTFSSENVRACFLRILRELVPYSFADFSLGSSDTGGVCRLADPVVLSNYDAGFESEFLAQYDTVYSSCDYVSWLFKSAESLVYQESDLINDSMRRQSSFYSRYLLSFGLVHIAGIVLCPGGRFCGALTLYNTAEQGDFSDTDLYVLRQFLPHLDLLCLSWGSSADADEPLSCNPLKERYFLTAREIEIASCIFNGLSNKAIARQLSIAEDTVKKHIYHIFQKLDLSSRSELNYFLMHRGLADYLCTPQPESKSS